MKWTDCSLMLLDRSFHIYGPWEKSAPVFQIPPGTDLAVSPLTPIQYFWTISTYLEDFSISCPGAITVTCYTVIQLFYMFFMHYFSEYFPCFTMLGTANSQQSRKYVTKVHKWIYCYHECWSFQHKISNCFIPECHSFWVSLKHLPSWMYVSVSPSRCSLVCIINNFTNNPKSGFL